VKGKKVKIHLVNYHEGTEGEHKYRSIL